MEGIIKAPCQMRIRRYKVVSIKMILGNQHFIGDV